jgi:hypothetical protein
VARNKRVNSIVGPGLRMMLQSMIDSAVYFV